jgi:hypothetical protein
MTGNLVRQEAVTARQVELHMQNLPTGMYMVYITQCENSFSQKVYIR